MKNLLQLPTNLKITRIKKKYIIKVTGRPICHCGGKFHIHTTYKKEVKLAYIFLTGTITATIHYYYYSCSNCGHYLLDDAELGIQHFTTLHYRKTICTFAATSTVSKVAKITGINASTIRCWQKQLEEG